MRRWGYVCLVVWLFDITPIANMCVNVILFFIFFVFVRKIGKDLTTILAQKYNIYRILPFSYLYSTIFSSFCVFFFSSPHEQGVKVRVENEKSSILFFSHILFNIQRSSWYTLKTSKKYVNIISGEFRDKIISREIPKQFLLFFSLLLKILWITEISIYFLKFSKKNFGRKVSFSIVHWLVEQDRYN